MANACHPPRRSDANEWAAIQSYSLHPDPEENPLKRFLALLTLVALPAFAAEDPELYGRYEYIRLPEIGQTLKAKMDTGALTASLSAKDIERFKRDGDDWVRFRLATKDADDTVYEHRLARISKIKTRSEEAGDDEDDEREKGRSDQAPGDRDGNVPGRHQAHRRGQSHRPQQLQLPAADRRQGPARVPRRHLPRAKVHRRQAPVLSHG